MNLAYVRVSTQEQNEARQVEALKKYDIPDDGWYIEKISGKDANQPKLQEMLKYARKGDTIYVHDFSRLARSTKDILDILAQLEEKGVALHSNKENFNTSTAEGRMMITMLSAIYQFEREIMLERQKEGIQIAKREGKYAGRKPISIDDITWKRNYERYMNRELNKSQLAKKLNISRPTLDKLLKEVG